MALFSSLETRKCQFAPQKSSLKTRSIQNRLASNSSGFSQKFCGLATFCLVICKTFLPWITCFSGKNNLFLNMFQYSNFTAAFRKWTLHINTDDKLFYLWSFFPLFLSLLLFFLRQPGHLLSIYIWYTKIMIINLFVIMINYEEGMTWFFHKIGITLGIHQDTYFWASVPGF